MNYLESDVATMHPLISWRSVVAGLLISFFVMAGLMGLGFAIGGISLNEDSTMGGIGTFSGIWFGVSAFISIFAGAYYSARISKFQNGKIGGAQGLIIASLFLGFFLYEAGSAVGTFGGAAGSIVSKSASVLGKGAQKASTNPEFQASFNRVIENTIGDLNLQERGETVAINLGNRLIRGDEEGAITYLSSVSGISESEARARLSQLRIQAQEAVGDAKNMAGEALKATGWTLFSMFILGAISALLGGFLGSRSNLRNPLSLRQAEAGTISVK